MSGFYFLYLMLGEGVRKKNEEYNDFCYFLGLFVILSDFLLD